MDVRLKNQVAVGLLLAAIALHVHQSAAPTEDPNRPLVGGKLRVLVTFNPLEKDKLTKDQVHLIESSSFREHLDKVCKDDGAAGPAWRFLPLPGQFEDDQPAFKKLLAHERSGDAWMYGAVGNKVVISEPLPKDEDAAKKLLGKFAR